MCTILCIQSTSVAYLPSPIPPPLQYSLPLELLNDVTMPGWMTVVEAVVTHPMPPERRKVPEKKQLSTEWWKAKKWATRVWWRIFEQLVEVQCISTVFVLWSGMFTHNMYFT